MSGVERILTLVERNNSNLMEFVAFARKELDFRESKPLYAARGKVYCTKCSEEVEEKKGYTFCPVCGQKYSS